MATVTVDQRKAFAKAGIAMPDGSYYIRNASDLHNAILAVGRGDTSHDAIRKHCIARAHALHLDSMIPSNWNSDGSLKHMISEEDAQRAKDLTEQALRHEKLAATHAQTAVHYSEQHAELLKHGINAPAFVRVYGDRTSVQGDLDSYKRTGKRRAQALQETANQLTWLHDQSIKHANDHEAQARSLRKRAARALWMNYTPSSEKTVVIQPGFDGGQLSEFLEHFGVKGMHWGVRRDRSSGGSSHPTSADAARAHATAAIVRRHGTSAVSNADLQHLVNRLNLESQHGKLDQRKVSQGEKIAKEIITNTAKQTAQAFAAKYAAQGAEKLIKLAAKKAVGG